jgi:histidine ammonia-lyase
MPASVFSRSTECHNQDKVSMGTIAARDCIRVLELTEQCAAAMLIASVQGVQMRQVELGDELKTTLSQLREQVPYLETDRAMEQELRLCIDLIQQQHWVLYE